MGITNKKWILKSRPNGLVEKSNFEFIEENLPDIEEGQILIETEYLSVDPTPVSYTHLTLPTILLV